MSGSSRENQNIRSDPFEEDNDMSVTVVEVPDEGTSCDDAVLSRTIDEDDRDLCHTLYKMNYTRNKWALKLDNVAKKTLVIQEQAEKIEKLEAEVEKLEAELAGARREIKGHLASFEESELKRGLAESDLVAMNEAWSNDVDEAVERINMWKRRAFRRDALLKTCIADFDHLADLEENEMEADPEERAQDR